MTLPMPLILGFRSLFYGYGPSASSEDSANNTALVPSMSLDVL